MASSGFTLKEEKSNLSSKDETENDVNQHGSNCCDNLEMDHKNTLEMVLKEMKKLNEKFYTKMEDMKTQFRNDMNEVQLEVRKEIGQLKKSGEMNERALRTLFSKVDALGEEANKRKRETEERSMREMSVVQRKNMEIGVVQEWFRTDRLVEMTEEMMRKVKEKLGTAHERFRESQEKMRETYERFMEPQDKMAAQKKREPDEKMIEKRMAEERKNNNVAKSPSSDNVNGEVKKIESSRKEAKDEIKEKSEDANLQMTCFSLIDNYGQFEPSFVWTIGGMKDKLSLNTFSMTSKVFEWARYAVSARVTLELTEDDCVCVFLKVENAEELEKVKPMPQVFYLLKGQDPSTSVCSGAKCRFQPSSLDPFVFDSSFGYKALFTTESFIIDDSVTIEVYVEPPFMARKTHSYNGTLNWVIEDYSKKLQAEIKDLIWDDTSPYFYTGPKGFKVQAHMKLNWKEAFVYIVILRGEFDSELPLTFPHETTVTLVNRKNPEGSIIKTIEADVKSNEYEVVMGSFTEVEKVLENDTLFCRVTIKPLEIIATKKLLYNTNLKLFHK